jgi:hypothetical protein
MHEGTKLRSYSCQLSTRGTERGHEGAAYWGGGGAASPYKDPTQHNPCAGSALCAHLRALDQRHLALPVDLGGGLLWPCGRAVNDRAAAHQRGRQGADVGQVALRRVGRAPAWGARRYPTGDREQWRGRGRSGIGDHPLFVVAHLHSGRAPLAEEVGRVHARADQAPNIVALVQRLAHDLPAQCPRRPNHQDGVLGHGRAGDGAGSRGKAPDSPGADGWGGVSAGGVGRTTGQWPISWDREPSRTRCAGAHSGRGRTPRRASLGQRAQRPQAGQTRRAWWLLRWLLRPRRRRGARGGFGGSRGGRACGGQAVCHQLVGVP